MKTKEQIQEEIRKLEQRRFLLNMADFLSQEDRDADRNMRDEIIRLQNELKELEGETDGRN